MKPFIVEVQHSESTVYALIRAQYSVSHKTARIIQVISAIISILIGVNFIGHVKQPINYLFILYGCFSVVFINVPVKSMAQKVVHQIKDSGHKYPCSVFTFNNDGFAVKAKGPLGKTECYEYKKCERLLSYRHATYYFINKEAAFIFPDQCITGMSVKEFQNFLSGKTEKPCRTLYPWLTASVWSAFKRIKKKS